MATGVKKSRAKKTAKRIPPSARRVRGGLKCPDCGFVAKHAMGLGRHRSARHGVVSKRSARQRTAGRWLTRQQAAERADVHYNTIRQWEQAGLIKTQKRPGVRGLLLSADDLERFLVERGGFEAVASAGVSDAAIRALQDRYDRLITDLEQLLDAAKSARPSSDGRAKRRPGRPKGSKTKRKAVRSKAPKKTRAAARRPKAKGARRPKAKGKRRTAKARARR